MTPLLYTETLVLNTLFELGRASLRVTPTSVALRAGLRRGAVDDALRRLDRRGWVRADHCRLTLLGLGTAARTSAILPTLAQRAVRVA